MPSNSGTTSPMSNPAQQSTQAQSAQQSTRAQSAQQSTNVPENYGSQGITLVYNNYDKQSQDLITMTDSTSNNINSIIKTKYEIGSIALLKQPIDNTYLTFNENNKVDTSLTFEFFLMSLLPYDQVGDLSFDKIDKNLFMTSAGSPPATLQPLYVPTKYVYQHVGEYSISFNKSFLFSGISYDFPKNIGQKDVVSMISQASLVANRYGATVFGITNGPGRGVNYTDPVNYDDNAKIWLGWDFDFDKAPSNLAPNSTLQRKELTNLTEKVNNIKTTTNSWVSLIMNATNRALNLLNNGSFLNANTELVDIQNTILVNQELTVNLNKINYEMSVIQDTITSVKEISMYYTNRLHIYTDKLSNNFAILKISYSKMKILLNDLNGYLITTKTNIVNGSISTIDRNSRISDFNKIIKEMVDSNLVLQSPSSTLSSTPSSTPSSSPLLQEYIIQLVKELKEEYESDISITKHGIGYKFPYGTYGTNQVYIAVKNPKLRPMFPLFLPFTYDDLSSICSMLINAFRSSRYNGLDDPNYDKQNGSLQQPIDLSLIQRYIFQKKNINIDNYSIYLDPTVHLVMNRIFVDSESNPKFPKDKHFIDSSLKDDNSSNKKHDYSSEDGNSSNKKYLYLLLAVLIVFLIYHIYKK